MKSKQEAEEMELRKFDQVESDVLVDDYKDLKIEMVASSRGKSLGWNRFNDYD